MLRAILVTAILAPISLLPVYANGTDEMFPEMQEGSTFNPKLEALENCIPTDISIHFSKDIYLEMHSANYLSAAIEKAKGCNKPAAIITGFEYDSSTPEDNALTAERIKEVAAYMEVYNMHYERTPDLVSIPVSSALLNGLTVKVEFTYGNSNGIDI